MLGTQHKATGPQAGGPPATAERVQRMMANSAEEHFEPFKSHALADIGSGMPRAPGV